jgi:hypothetical protein
LNPLYEALLERDEAAARRAIDAFDDDAQLFLAVARFAVLAYAPAQHAKHALLAALAAWDLREDYGERWRGLLAECAVYAGGSRLPWSEPPILDMTPVNEDLDAALRDGDRLAAERWLAFHLDSPDLEQRYFEAASRNMADIGMNLIISSAAWRLAPILGEKGRFATLRIGPVEWTARKAEPIATGERASRPLEAHGDLERGGRPLPSELAAQVVAERGSLEATHAVFLYDATASPSTVSVPIANPPIYPLARDYAQLLIAHAVVKRRSEFAAILPAVRENLEAHEGFEEWSFA